MINEMPDNEFIEHMSFISGINNMYKADYEDLWFDNKNWKNVADKFYGYDNKNENYNN